MAVSDLRDMSRKEQTRFRSLDHAFRMLSYGIETAQETMDAICVDEDKKIEKRPLGWWKWFRKSPPRPVSWIDKFAYRGPVGYEVINKPSGEPDHYLIWHCYTHLHLEWSDGVAHIMVYSHGTDKLLFRRLLEINLREFNFRAIHVI